MTFLKASPRNIVYIPTAQSGDAWPDVFSECGSSGAALASSISSMISSRVTVSTSDWLSRDMWPDDVRPTCWRLSHSRGHSFLMNLFPAPVCRLTRAARASWIWGTVGARHGRLATMYPRSMGGRCTPARDPASGVLLSWLLSPHLLLSFLCDPRDPTYKRKQRKTVRRHFATHCFNISHMAEIIRLGKFTWLGPIIWIRGAAIDNHDLSE